MTSTVPPAAEIFSAAFTLNLCARTVSDLESSPRPNTFKGWRDLLTRPS